MYVFYKISRFFPEGPKAFLLTLQKNGGCAEPALRFAPMQEHIAQHIYEHRQQYPSRRPGKNEEYVGHNLVEGFDGGKSGGAMGVKRQSVGTRQKWVGMGDGIGGIMMRMGKGRTAHIVTYKKYYQQVF